MAAFSRLADSDGSDSDAYSDELDSSSDESAQEEWDASSFLGAPSSIVATPVHSFCISDNTHRPRFVYVAQVLPKRKQSWLRRINAA